MSFIMPSDYWKSSNTQTPTPMADSGVKLESSGGGMIASSKQVAVMWFGGFASKELVQLRKISLKTMLDNDADWQAADETEEALLLQYNVPFVPPWKRRNE